MWDLLPLRQDQFAQMNRTLDGLLHRSEARECMSTYPYDSGVIENTI